MYEVDNMKKKIKYIFLVFILIVIIYGLSELLNYYNIHKRYYTADFFNIETIKSPIDYNHNGIDDYTDILNGAKREALVNPKYQDGYYRGGYPPDNVGVCTDTIWRSLKEAGYDLKDMVDDDIKNNLALYPRVNGHPDTNIDFRRVKNLKVFFDRHALNLTLDLSDIALWQPGDIVIFGDNYNHIAIISDKRNRKGIPYIIHNAGQRNKEEDTLERWASKVHISGHYRFKS